MTKYFRVRKISYLGRKTSVLTQEDDGPCPLIAIANYLSLRRKMEFPSDVGEVQDIAIMSSIIELLESMKPGTRDAEDGSARANTKGDKEWEEILDLVMEVLPKLPNGLDCIPNFTDPELFEPNIATILFSTLRIRLFHAWVVDSEKEAPIFEILQNKSYDDLQLFLTQYSSGALHGDEATHAFLAGNWLSDNAQQSTEFGMKKLREMLNENELGVLYRNGHYSVITKKNNRLYALVTADSLCDEYSQIVWESVPEFKAELRDMGDYYNSDFYLINSFAS